MFPSCTRGKLRNLNAESRLVGIMTTALFRHPSWPGADEAQGNCSPINNCLYSSVLEIGTTENLNYAPSGQI